MGNNEFENMKEEQLDTPDTPFNSGVVSPSFKGKLDLANFEFSPKPKIDGRSTFSKQRQSPRRNASTSSLLTPSTNAKATKMARPVNVFKQNSTSFPRKKSRGIADPLKYVHFGPSPLQDVLAENLICLFVGMNPGVMTATTGHAYAHPTNLFWKLLHLSGCTDRRLRPEEDGDLPRLYELGNTNIVARATATAAEVSNKEMDASVGVLVAKIRKFRPEVVCIVGKGIWLSIWRVKHQRAIKEHEFKYGWQDDKEMIGATEGEWKGAKVFVASTTSGAAASLSPDEKLRIWTELGVWVKQRRTERAAMKAEGILETVLKFEPDI